MSIYASKGLNVKRIFPLITKNLNDENFINFTKFSLDLRFRNILYNYNSIKRFDPSVLQKSNVKEIPEFKSNNIGIYKDNFKYIIKSKKPELVPCGNLVTALSIIDNTNHSNLPIFLYDDFTVQDLSFAKFLNDEFSSLKMFFNFNNDLQFHTLKICEIDRNAIYIKKFCTADQLENSLEKINYNFDDYYHCYKRNIFLKDTLLCYYHLIDTDNYDSKFRNDEEFLMPKSLNVGDFLILKP